MSVRWLVGMSVCHHFKKGWESYTSMLLLEHLLIFLALTATPPQFLVGPERGRAWPGELRSRGGGPAPHLHLVHHQPQQHDALQHDHIPGKESPGL